MDRLAERLRDVLDDTINCLSEVQEEIINAALDRLSAYEMTGLTPGDISTLYSLGFELKCADKNYDTCVGDCGRWCTGYKWHINGIPADRLKELTESDLKERHDGEL